MEIKRVQLEGTAINLKNGRARLQFTVAEDAVLPDLVRDSLSQLERTDGLCLVSVKTLEGENVLSLERCRPISSIKIGPGRGVLTITTPDIELVWEKRDILELCIHSDTRLLVLEIVPAQPELL